ncbi:MAG: WbqC family protein [Thermodesulfobacteriota bacterium]
MGKTKKVAILQSNYIPWKGYFDLINMVDEFILYDDMQYTRRDWRNRNIIKTANGPLWLTIPVDVKGKYYQSIKDTKIQDPSWTGKHWKSISHNYAKAEFFARYRDIFEDLYHECGDEEFLSKVNFRFIEAICRILGIETELTWSMDYDLAEGKTERLVALCADAGATHYISGPAAKDYIEDDLFKEAGIGLSYMDYSGYRPYRQLYGEFTHRVSIIDLLFNEGPGAVKFMKSF